MWFIWMLLALSVMYVAIGVIAIYINGQSKDEEFKFDWTKVLSWPKDVFGK